MNKQELKDRLDNYDARVGYMKGAVIKITREELHDLIDQLDEPEITEEQAWRLIAETHNQDEAYWLDAKNRYMNSISESEKPELPVIPQFVADWIARRKVARDSLIWSLAYGQGAGKQEILDWLCDRSYSERLLREELILKAWEVGYTIEPEKKVRIAVGKLDGTYFRTELPESEARKLIEGWKEECVKIGIVNGC